MGVFEAQKWILCQIKQFLQKKKQKSTKKKLFGLYIPPQLFSKAAMDRILLEKTHDGKECNLIGFGGLVVQCIMGCLVIGSLLGKKLL
jgi:hypothetical protein